MDFSQAREYLRSTAFLGDLVKVIGAAGLTYLLTRLGKRMTVVSWAVSTFHLAASGKHDRFGEISVKYGAVDVDNIFMAQITVTNESGTVDLKDMPLAFLVQSNAWIVGQGQHYRHDTIPFSETWRAARERQRTGQPYAGETKDALDEWVNKRREFLLPVLNRGESLRFDFALVSWDGAVPPTLEVAIAQAGVKVRRQPTGPHLMGVPTKYAVITGALVGVALTLLVALVARHPMAIGFASFAVGATASILGALTIRAWRYLRRLFA